MWGKILGALLGAGLGMLLAWSPPIAALLATLGALLGHLVVDREPDAPRSERPPTSDELLQRPRPPRRRPDAMPRPPPRRRQPSPEQQELADSLCPLFIEVARADAPVTQAEVRIVREFFEQQLGFDDVAMEPVRLALKDALSAPPADVPALVTRARTALKPALRVEVVRALYDVSLTDGDLQRSELDTLKQIVGGFNLSEEQLQSITGQLFGSASRSYEVLGLSPEVEDDAIKSAYRRLAAEHHPDRTNDGGARFREIKEAYEALRKLRGF
jgi:DnaJ like chaperone protein